MKLSLTGLVLISSSIVTMMSSGVLASNSTLYTLDSGSTTTAYSGTQSIPLNQTVGSVGDFKAINRVTNWEASNDPCQIKVKMRHLNNYAETSADVDITPNCSNDKITVGYADTETYIRGIQVCHNNNKIKGLKVWGSKLNRNTGILTNVGYVQDTRPNCSQWKAKRFCPPGEVATQLKVQADQMGIRYSTVALVCRKIVPK